MNRQIGETELYELETLCTNITKVELEPVTRLIKEVKERREHEDKYGWHAGHPSNEHTIHPCELEILTKNGYEIVRFFPNDLYKFGDINSHYHHRGYKNYGYEEIIAYRIHEQFEEVTECDLKV